MSSVKGSVPLRSRVCLRDLVRRSLAKLSWLRSNTSFWLFHVTENTAIESLPSFGCRIVNCGSVFTCKCAGAGGKHDIESSTKTSYFRKSAQLLGFGTLKFLRLFPQLAGFPEIMQAV